MLVIIRKQIQNKPTISNLGEMLDLAEDKFDSDVIFDCCKAILESICKTILRDRGELIDESNDDLPRLAKDTLNTLFQNLEESGVEESERLSIKKIHGGIITSIHGICEMRKKYGRVSHGKDARQIGSIQLLRNFVLKATDVVGGLLLELHFDSLSLIEGHRLYYEDQLEFNEWYDDLYGDVYVGVSLFKASEALFKLDVEAYKETLNDFIDNKNL